MLCNLQCFAQIHCLLHSQGSIFLKFIARHIRPRGNSAAYSLIASSVHAAMQRSWHQESLGLGFLAGGHRVKIRTPWSTGQEQASLCAPLHSRVLSALLLPLLLLSLICCVAARILWFICEYNARHICFRPVRLMAEKTTIETTRPGQSGSF